MQTIHATERTGSDGALNLRVSLGQPDTEFDVVVIVQPKAIISEHASWPAGYFDLAGSIDDDTFVRPPQGKLPPPVEFE